MELYIEGGVVTTVTWDNPVNKVVLRPELLKEMEQEVVKIR